MNSKEKSSLAGGGLGAVVVKVKYKRHKNRKHAKNNKWHQNNEVTREKKRIPLLQKTSVVLQSQWQC